MRGRLEGDVLAGDLVLRGGGDPKLVIEDMVELVGRLRASGLREISGNLVIDDSLYEVGDDSVEKFDGDPSQPYNVRPHAALMNFKATKFIVRPSGKLVSIELDPPLAGVPLLNEVRLVAGACRFGAPGLAIRDAGPEERPVIRIGGAYSAGCGEQSTMAAVLNHRQFIHGFFGAAWRAAGGVWSGRTVVERDPGPALPTLAQWTSTRNLGEVVRDVNKFSNNVMARQLLLQTSADASRRQPATLERARRVVVVWLEQSGLRAAGEATLVDTLDGAAGARGGARCGGHAGVLPALVRDMSVALCTRRDAASCAPEHGRKADVGARRSRAAGVLGRMACSRSCMQFQGRAHRVQANDARHAAYAESRGLIRHVRGCQ